VALGTLALALATAARARSTWRDVRASQLVAEASLEANELHKQEMGLTELAKLLERFETLGTMVLVWRMEQATRPPPGNDSAALDRKDIAELRSENRADPDRLKLIDLMLATDWSVQRAGMHEVYFFALRAHAWLAAAEDDGRPRLLNTAFGYQLLSTLLDHRTIALRLRDHGRDDTYYPTQYGCLDPPCRDLVDRLAQEFLSRPASESARVEIMNTIRRKWNATNEALLALEQRATP
jgi:hypothetical protein